MMNMIPMKGIKNNTNNNCSYIHSVLQSLSCLESSKLFFTQNNFNIFNMNLSITIELFNIMKALDNGFEAFSGNIINYYQNKVNMINHTNSAFSGDPYHFLFYLLELIHYENNIPLDIFYNIQFLYSQNLQMQGNDDYMYIIFYDFFRRTQNSLISNYYFNIEKYRTCCQKCGTLYFYGIKKILRFNIDMFRIYRDQAYPFKSGKNLTLDDCFRCYIGGNSASCQNCRNISIKTTKLCCTTKVLIIYLERKNHKFYCDVDFEPSLNIINYFSIKRSNNITYNPIYNLKACISYDQNLSKYFSDCYVAKNNFSGWYRFIDDKVRKLDNPYFEVHKYEPQLLIYELDQQNFNNRSISFNPFLKNNAYILNIINMFNNMNIPNFNIMSNFNPNNQNVKMDFTQEQNLKMMNIMKQQNNNETKILFNRNENNNINNISFNPMNNKIAFTLKFIYVPEIGDQSETSSNKIGAQVLSDFTFEKAVNNFFTKLLKPRKAIKRFLLNGNEIASNCKTTLVDLNINENTVIKAIKSEDFDQLKLET